MSGIDQARCASCRFFVLKEPQHTYGDCHRMPPLMELSVHIKRDTYPERDMIDVRRFSEASWPNVHNGQWCGEHQRVDA